jgi:hypothetical protein
MVMVIKLVWMILLAKEVCRPGPEEMTSLDNGEDGDAEEGEEGPQDGDDDPAREKLLGELVGSAIETVSWSVFPLIEPPALFKWSRGMKKKRLLTSEAR